MVEMNARDHHPEAKQQAASTCADERNRFRILLKVLGSRAARTDAG